MKPAFSPLRQPAINNEAMPCDQAALVGKEKTGLRDVFRHADAAYAMLFFVGVRVMRLIPFLKTPSPTPRSSWGRRS